MHSQQLILTDGSTVICHTNGDFSGDVKLVLPAQMVTGIGGSMDVEVRVPFEVMEHLVGQHRIQERIARLEGLSGREFLDQELPVR